MAKRKNDAANEGKQRSRAPRVDARALGEVRRKKTDVDTLRVRLQQFENDRRDGALSTQFIALEALSALIGGREADYSDDDLQKAWPVEWGAETMKVPVALVRALRDGWLVYRKASTGQTLGEVFKIEGGGQGKQPARRYLQTQDKHRSLANAVALEYLAAKMEGAPISLETAISLVAEKTGAKFQTVRDAHQEFWPDIKKGLKDRGLLGP